MLLANNNSLWKVHFAIAALFTGLIFAENVPTNYVAYALEELKFGNGGGTNGSGLVGSKGNVTIGSDARVQGSVLAKGNIALYDRSIVYGNATAGGTVSKINGASVTGTIKQNAQVPVYTIPARTVPTGSQNILVFNDKTTTINPGNYNSTLLAFNS